MQPATLLKALLLSAVVIGMAQANCLRNMGCGACGGGGCGACGGGGFGGRAGGFIGYAAAPAPAPAPSAGSSSVCAPQVSVRAKTVEVPAVEITHKKTIVSNPCPQQAAAPAPAPQYYSAPAPAAPQYYSAGEESGEESGAVFYQGGAAAAPSYYAASAPSAGSSNICAPKVSVRAKSVQVPAVEITHSKTIVSNPCPQHSSGAKSYYGGSYGGSYGAGPVCTCA